MLANVRIRTKGKLSRGVVENNDLTAAQGVVENRLRQRGPSNGLVTPAHDDSLATGRRFGCNPLFASVRKNQQPSLRTCLLDGGAHEYIDELALDDLPGDGLRHLDDGRKIEVFDWRRDRASRVSGALPGLELR